MIARITAALLLSSCAPPIAEVRVEPELADVTLSALEGLGIAQCVDVVVTDSPERWPGVVTVEAGECRKHGSDGCSRWEMSVQWVVLDPSAMGALSPGAQSALAAHELTHVILRRNGHDEEGVFAPVARWSGTPPGLLEDVQAAVCGEVMHGDQ